MKLSKSLFIPCLLASFFSRSGAQSSPVGRTNLSDCTIKCLQEKYYDYDLSDVCDQAKNVDFRSYSVCLAGKDNAFKQVCEASCDVVNAKTLLKRSHQNACRRVTTRYGSCMEGYLETWKRLSSFATTIKEESAKVNELVRDSTDNTQQLQSETSNAQVLLQEVIDQATEEQLESNVEIATVDWISDHVSSLQLQTELVPTLSTVTVEEESNDVKESVSDLDITQQQSSDDVVQALVQEIDQETEEQLESNVEIETFGRVSSFEMELVPTPGEELPSKSKHSVELNGVTGSAATIHHSHLKSIKVGLPFYTLQHISVVSNHDTTSQLQTGAGMGERIIGEFNYGGEDSSWNIASMYYLTCLTHIHAEVTDHMLWPSRRGLFANASGYGEGGAAATIQATQPVDLCQFIDTGPSSRSPPFDSIIGEVDWSRILFRFCAKEITLFETPPDILGLWKHFSVENKRIEEHSKHSVDSKIEFPSYEFISAAEITCSSPLDMDEGSSGRSSFGKIDGPSYEVLLLHSSISMLVNLFDADNITPSNIDPQWEFNVKESASLITVEVIASIDVLIDIDTISHLLTQSDTLESVISGVNSLKMPICGCMTKGYGALWILEKDNDLKLIVETFFNQVIVISEDFMCLIQSYTEMNIMSTLEIFPAEIERGRYFDLLPDSTSVDNCVSVGVKVYTQNYLAIMITLIKQVLAVYFDTSTSLFGPLLQHHATKVMPFVLLLCVSISLIGWARGKDHASRGIATENSSFLTLSVADKDSSAKAAVMIIEVDAPQELSAVNDMRKDFDGYSDSMRDDSTAVQVHDALTGLDHPSFIAYIRNLSCDVWSLRESIFYELHALMLFMLVYHNHNPDGSENESDDVVSSGSVTPPGTDLELEEISNEDVISTDGDNEEDFVLSSNTDIQPSRRELMALRSELGSHWNSPSKRRVWRSPRTRSRPQYFQPT